MRISEIAPADILVGYIEEGVMAEQRGVVIRTLQAERQRGAGPPWAKVGRDVYYPVEGFREWLKSIEQRPVRLRKAG